MIKETSICFKAYENVLIEEEILFINSIKQNKFKLDRFILTSIYTIIYIIISFYSILSPYLLLNHLLNFFSKETIHIPKICFFIVLIIIIIFHVYMCFFRSSQADFLVELKNIKDIPSRVNLLEYYQILPFFLINLCFVPPIFVFFFKDDIFIDLSILSIYILVIIYLIISAIFILSNLDYNLYYTLNRANDILDDYIIKNQKEYLIILEFNNYFRKSLDNIDRNLLDEVKIDKLKVDSNETIKKTIIHYLPIYIKYGNQNQIKSLKNHIIRMLELIDKKKYMGSLEITEIILNVHNDIEFFLKSNNYSITKQHWNIRDIKLSHLCIQRLSNSMPQICIIVISFMLLYILSIYPILKSTPSSTFMYLLVPIFTIISPIAIKPVMNFFKKKYTPDD